MSLSRQTVKLHQLVSGNVFVPRGLWCEIIVLANRADGSQSHLPQTFQPKPAAMTRRHFEQLEPRCMLAGWQNPAIRFDVDNSASVEPLDALLILTDIGRHGSRPLEEPFGIDNQSVQRFWDVNGDGWIVPLDALLVLTSLYRNQQPLSLAVNLAPDIDPNGNGVVLRTLVELSGQTSHDASVQVEAFAVDSMLNERAGESSLTEVVSDSLGSFSLNQHLFPGRNRLKLTVTDEIGRRHSVEREIIVSDVVADWNAAMLNVVRDWTTTSNDPFQGRIVASRPPEVARSLAMVHAAMFDAINLIEGGYTPYASVDSAQLPADLASASAVAAAATAAYDVATAIYPESRERAVWVATLAESLATVSAGTAKERGIEVGRAVAAALLAMRANDGADAASQYSPGDLPGQWNRTSPAFLPPLLPHWGNVEPMVVEDITAYRPAPPPSLDSLEYAEAVDEVMELGRLNSNVRTAEQTEIALFWLDGGGTATPPGHWNRIAITASIASGDTTLQRARSLALLNLAMADAGISSWDAKYHYDFWRPIDAIRRANEDGNSATIADSQWLPLVVTPPFPAYTSGHSSFSGAAAEALTAIYGSELTFASTSDSHSGLTQKPLSTTTIRQFDNFWSAAKEASDSRIYGGIHYKFDSSAGLQAGEAIASYAIQTLLKRI